MAEAGRQRIDKWLFYARVSKSRTLAQKLAQSGHVRVNREKISSAATPVGPGDVLTITLERRVLVYRVLDPGSRRGPASEARLLYEDMSPPAPPTEPSAPMDRPAAREPGAGRPTKRQRRQTDAFRGD